MKRTPEDQQFGNDFARKLRPYYEAALASGETVESFANRLGINRGGLQRYLRDGATPSLRTLAFAYREFRIVVPYADVSTKAVVSGKTRLRGRSAEFQLDLPLNIGPVGADIEVVEMKKRPKGYRIKFQLTNQSGT